MSSFQRTNKMMLQHKLSYHYSSHFNYVLLLIGPDLPDHILWSKSSLSMRAIIIIGLNRMLRKVEYPPTTSLHEGERKNRKSVEEDHKDLFVEGCLSRHNKQIEQTLEANLPQRKHLKFKSHNRLSGIRESYWSNIAHSKCRRILRLHSGKGNKVYWSESANK